MMTARVLAVLALAGLSLGMGQAPAARIDYTLTPVLDAGVLTAVEVDLRFRGEADGETVLRLPDAWAGREQLWRAITALEVRSGAAMAEGDGPARRVLTHRPGAAIHLRYRIVQDYEGLPAPREGNPYRAVVQPDYFHLIGHAAFITPQDAHAETPVRVRAQRMPRGWRYASDLEHGGLTLARLGSSISVGGDFRIYHGADRNIRVAVRGQWGFSEAGFVAQVNEIITGQRRFWGDASTPYLVTLMQLHAPDANFRSVGGTGLEDAFGFFATPNATGALITHMIAHESLHAWIPSRLGGAQSAPEAAGYWFSEGFTDFYTGRLLVRQGLWTPADFAEDINAMLRAYALSSVRDAPNAHIVAAFWSDRAVRQLPYQRGRLAATLWDYRLRADGQSLDAVMLVMAAHADTGEAGPATALLARLAGERGLDLSADYAALIEAGAPIVLPADVFAPCGVVETLNTPLFDLGFDFSAARVNTPISGVDRAGPAYAAGVRDGMVLQGLSFEHGNTDAAVSLRVQDGDGVQAFGYLPRGRASVPVQQLMLSAALEGDALAACRVALGGP